MGGLELDLGVEAWVAAGDFDRIDRMLMRCGGMDPVDLVNLV